MSHTYKTVSRPPRLYSPTDLVRRHGDYWARHTMLRPDMALALLERTPDMDDLFAMTLMEKGISPRVER